MAWFEVAKVEELTLGLHPRTVAGTRVLLAVVDGKLSAFSPLCPHSGGPLEYAETHGAEIVCPLHGWRFDLQRGGCEAHGYRPLRMFDVRVEAGTIFVAVEQPSRPLATSQGDVEGAR